MPSKSVSSFHYGVADALSQNSRLGIYFHIPFCAHICPYCDFTKTSRFSKKDADVFFSHCQIQLDSLLEQRPKDITHCTIYFGGGTPGLFPGDRYVHFIEKIKKHFIVEEVTLETNPFTNVKTFFNSWKEAGIDRLTLGAQSLCDSTLKLLGRKHRAADVYKNLDWALAAGFQKIQTDLIYGLEEGIRTVSLESEVKNLLENGASGISGYALTLEERTSFGKSGKISETVAASEYNLLYETCVSNGLKQLETANFSKYEALHNNIYWHGLPYWGIGTGAHGLSPATEEFPLGERYRVGEVPSEISPGNDKLVYSLEAEALKNFLIVKEKPRSMAEYFDEMLFTLFRTSHGIPLDWIERFGRKDAVNNIKTDGKIMRGLSTGALILENNCIQMSWKEKIRGDSWSLHLSQIAGH